MPIGPTTDPKAIAHKIAVRVSKVRGPVRDTVEDGNFFRLPLKSDVRLYFNEYTPWKASPDQHLNIDRLRDFQHRQRQRHGSVTSASIRPDNLALSNLRAPAGSRVTTALAAHHWRTESAPSIYGNFIRSPRVLCLRRSGSHASGRMPPGNTTLRGNDGFLA
jgi:hypothetical protein